MTSFLLTTRTTTIDDKNEYRYNLQTVAQTFLGKSKNDMDMEDLFQAYTRKDRKVLKDVGEYCVQDTVLLQSLVYCNKLKIVESLVALANVVRCPIEYILQRGQQIRVISQVSETAAQEDTVVPDSHTIEDRSIGECDPIRLFDKDGFVVNSGTVAVMPQSTADDLFGADAEGAAEDEDIVDDDDDHAAEAAGVEDAKKQKTVNVI